MSYPVLRVNLGAMESNMNAIVSRCSARGISVWGVTKGLSAPAELALRLDGTGAAALADSRIANIKRMRDAGVKKPLVLIRIPMRSELEDVIELADCSLVSDTGTLKAMADICARKKKEHKVLIMADMGDLREGFNPSEAESAADAAKEADGHGLIIDGVGVNFACASGVLPSREGLEGLVRFGRTIEAAIGRKLSVFSGGATTMSLSHIDSELFPSEINNLRIGEGYLLGTDKSCGEIIPWLSQQTMILEAELVETRVKPTLPSGRLGRDSFGNVPVFEDRGNRLRGVLAIGKQDVYIDGLVPLNDGVRIITASSDHLIVDIEECGGRFKVGDILRFRPEYPAMLSASTSAYVTKIFEN